MVMCFLYYCLVLSTNARIGKTACTSVLTAYLTHTRFQLPLLSHTSAEASLGNPLGFCGRLYPFALSHIFCVRPSHSKWTQCADMPQKSTANIKHGSIIKKATGLIVALPSSILLVNGSNTVVTSTRITRKVRTLDDGRPPLRAALRTDKPVTRRAGGHP